MAAMDKLVVLVLSWTLVCLIGFSSGQLVMSGCTGSWLHFKCPGNDKLNIHDVRIENPNRQTLACYLTDPKKGEVPTEVTHLCPSKDECLWGETFCDGKNECAFFLSPTLLQSKPLPDKDAQVIVTYSCNMGSSRTAGVVVLVIFTFIFAGLTALGVYWLLHRKESMKFDQFTNDNTSVASGPVSKPSASYSADSGDVNITSSRF